MSQIDLKTRVDEEMKIAMKAGEGARLRLGTLRILLAELKNHKISTGRDVTDEDVISVVQREVKKRRQAIDEYTKIGRDELVKQESEELAVLEEFLPAQLTESEVRSVINRIADEIGDLSEKDMGRLMGPVMKELKGQADGSLINRLVRERLSGG